MKKDEIMYGLKDQEILVSSIDEVMEDVFTDNLFKIGEGDAAIAERIEWPVMILEYKRISTDHYAQSIADRALEEALERLDEEYGNPDGDSFVPTETMKNAAYLFGSIVARRFVAWQCEPTGKVHEITKEDAMKGK